MPVPRFKFIDPTVNSAFEEMEDTAWERQFEDYTSDCTCPHRAYGGCVDDLGLPPRGQRFTHNDGRRGTFVRRVRRHDPVNLRILQTAVLFEHRTPGGQLVKWALKCAGFPPSFVA